MLIVQDVKKTNAAVCEGKFSAQLNKGKRTEKEEIKFIVYFV